MTNLTHSFHNGTGTGNITLLRYPKFCTLQTCDLSVSSFEYLPTLPGNALYAGILGVYILIQLFIGIKHKTWGYMGAMILGLALEVVGYVGRVLLHNAPFDHNNFLISLVTLTIAPALLTAAIYLCLARIVTVYGTHLSYFKPRTYTIVFCTCDLISLILQAAGGALASLANAKSQSDLGRNIMLAGLIFQVFSLILFAVCCAMFAVNAWKGLDSWNMQYADLVRSTLFKSFLVGLVVAVVTIFTRSVYRCVELSGGFNGTLFVSDEILFMILEGIMIILATSCLTFLHPAVCFQGAWHEANFNFRKKYNSSESVAQNIDEENESMPENVPLHSMGPVQNRGM